MTASASSNPSETKLARRLGLWSLILYGVGDILGAGIYALVGKVAGLAGQGAWLSFLVSALLAGITGVTYAQLCRRVPRSAGAAAYAAAAFGRPFIAFMVGFLVLASGLTSTATVSLAVHGYLTVFTALPAQVVALGMIGLVAAIAYVGIAFSARTNNVLTVLEACGLLLVIGAGFGAILFGLGSGHGHLSLWEALKPDRDVTAIFAGATLAFYAFIGFEDMANLAEEAKDPVRDLPRAILAAVGISTVLYGLVIVAVLGTTGPDAASASTRPLLDVLLHVGVGVPAGAFAVLAMFAVANTGLTNFVMVSRLLYGMADQGLLPRSLAAVDARRKTPWVAILVAAGLAIALAVTGGVKILAQTTSLLLVIVFTTLHVALLVLLKKEGSLRAATGALPAAGITVSLALMAHFPADAYARAVVVGGMGGVMYAILTAMRQRIS